MGRHQDDDSGLDETALNGFGTLVAACRAAPNDGKRLNKRLQVTLYQLCTEFPINKDLPLIKKKSSKDRVVIR